MDQAARETTRARVRVRPMRRGDLPQVAAIEAVSFSLPWKEEAFRRELEEFPNSHLLVAEGPLPEGPAPERFEILGYACWWLVVDECHIINFAVSPGRRRRGVGESLLAGLIEDARKRGTQRATLEVRAGNAAAIGMYEKFGFRPVALRKNYYPDNREDAIVMWIEGI